jgi:hypothetical protein
MCGKAFLQFLRQASLGFAWSEPQNVRDFFAAAVEGKQCRFSIDRVPHEAFPANPDKASAGYS